MCALYSVGCVSSILLVVACGLLGSKIHSSIIAIQTQLAG